MTFEIRDESGQIFNRVTNPAAVFDKETGTIHKIGERDVIIEHFNLMTEHYRAHGLHDVADDVTFMELPKIQDELDKVFQITGYIKRLHDRVFARSH